METVYSETTGIVTIATRVCPDSIFFACQLPSRRWWSEASLRFDPRISDLLIAECSAGEAIGAVVPGLNCLVTRDFRPIFDLHLQRRKVDVCRESASVPTIVCKPEQLMESYDNA